MKKFIVIIVCFMFPPFAFGGEVYEAVEVSSVPFSTVVDTAISSGVIADTSTITTAAGASTATVVESLAPNTSSATLVETSTLNASTGSAIKFLIKKVGKVDFELHTGMVTLKGVDAREQPTGFATTSDQSGNSLYYSIELKYGKKYKWVGIEWRPSGREQTLPYTYNGAPLGTLKVTTDHAVFLKVYPYNSPMGCVSIGVGKEHSTLEGNVSIGGFPLHSYLKGGAWATKLQFGAQFNATKRVGLNIGYEKGGAEVVTDFPSILGVPKPVTTTNTDMFTVGLTLKVF